MWLALPAWRAGLLIAVCCLAVYGPGLVLLPTIDRDEARFAQASRQMLEAVVRTEAQRDPDLHSGGAVVPMVGGRERINKPPMIYWLQAASAGALTLGQPARDAIWMYRVPSLVAAIVAVLSLWRMGCLRLGPRIGLLAGLMLAASPLFAWEARQARSDMVLVAATTVAMAALWSLFDGKGRHWYTPLVLWLAVTIGVLTKGPVILLVVLSAAIAASLAARRWRWLVRTQPWIGVVLIAATLGPWLFAVGERVGHAELWERIRSETLGRSLEPAEGHWGPPGYHLVLTAVLFWPGAALAGREFFGSVVRLFTGATGRRKPRLNLAMLAAWLIPTWVVMELISTKLPHYVLPLYPALALLSARAVVTTHRTGLDASADRGLAIGIGLWRWLGVAVFVGVPVAFAVLLHWLWWPIALVMLLAVGLPPMNPFKIGWLCAHERALVAASAFALLVPIGLALSPKIHLAQQLERTLGKPMPQHLAAVGYHEDSLVFATRGTLARLSNDDVEAFIRAHPDATLITPADSPIVGTRTIGEVEGFNYSKGRHQSLLVVRPGGETR